MKCLVCHLEINIGEQIFFGTQMILCGPGENDCEYSGDSEGLIGGIHLICLENPAAAGEMVNTAVPECVEEESEVVVSRSNALKLLEEIDF